MDLTVNGRHYAFDEYFACYLEEDYSTNDGKLHGRRLPDGLELAAGDIGDDLTLLFGSAGDCTSDAQELSHKAIVVSHPQNPDRLYLVDDRSESPSIIINNVSVKRVEETPSHLGPTKEQKALKEMLRDRQRGFHSVSVELIPPEKWDTSELNLQYFSRYRSVTVAEPEGRGKSAGFSAVSLFYPPTPMIREKEAIGMPKIAEEFPLIYNGEAFVLSGLPQTARGLWYATKQAQDSPYFQITGMREAPVDYKGIKLSVKSVAQVYDPETRSILQFTNNFRAFPWDRPEQEDIKRMKR
jgi:hypothetical protein